MNKTQSNINNIVKCWLCRCEMKKDKAILLSKKSEYFKAYYSCDKCEAEAWRASGEV